MNYTSKAVYQYISEKTNDPIVEWKVCAVSGQEFAIYQSDLDFYDKISPTFDGKKFQIPTPTLCREERQRRRMAFRNELNFFKRKCDATNELIISQYPDRDSLKVFKNTVWWEGNWESVQQGNPFSGKTVMETISQLMTYTPKPHMSVTNDLENSIYANNSSAVKNCYVIACANNCQDCYYSLQPWNSENCIDCSYIYGCKQCYGCVDSYYCTSSSYLKNCKQVENSSYCTNCERCEYCYGCDNLVDKKYCINNEQFSEEEYFEKISDAVLIANKKPIYPMFHQLSCENSYGNYLENCAECLWVFDTHDSKNCRYINSGNKFYDCRDISYFGINLSRSYESAIVGINSSHLLFCLDCYENVSHCIYSYQCFNSSNCFGCVGLRNAEYCIFNKQYTKEAYEKTVAKLIQSMIDQGVRGEFFVPGLSPFAYNETVAMDLFPLTEVEAKKLGYAWSSDKGNNGMSDTTNAIRPNLFTDEERVTLRDDDSLTNKIILCETSGKPFRILKQELEFYRQNTISLPKKHPNIRHKERLQKRPGNTFFLQNCAKSGEQILSVYPESSAYEVYSLEAYTKEMFN